MTGKIRMISPKGFAFVQPNGDQSRDSGHYFHAKHCLDGCFDSLTVFAQVEFDSVRGERGLEARNVKPVN